MTSLLPSSTKMAAKKRRVSSCSGNLCTFGKMGHLNSEGVECDGRCGGEQGVFDALVPGLHRHCVQG